MIDEMPCAYGTLHVASRPIYILLMCPTNPFRRMVTVGHNATVFVLNRIPTEPEEMAKLRSEGDMQRDASFWRWARSSLPPGWLCRLWRSASTLTEPFRPDGNVFSWWTCSLGMLVVLFEIIVTSHSPITLKDFVHLNSHSWIYVSMYLLIYTLSAGLAAGSPQV